MFQNINFPHIHYFEKANNLAINRIRRREAVKKGFQTKNFACKQNFFVVNKISNRYHKITV